MRKLPLPAIAALSLFSGSMQRQIIGTIRSATPGELDAMLDRTSNPLLPPGVLNFPEVENLLSDEELIGFSWAIAAVFAESLKSDDFGSNKYYLNLLQRVFMIDESYADKLAQQIDTMDDAKGAIDVPMSIVSGGWNAIARALDLPNLTVAAGSKDDEVDAAYEFVQLGGVILELVKRHYLMASSLNRVIEGGAGPEIRRIADAIQANANSSEGGDVISSDVSQHLRTLGLKYAPLPIPMHEQGGFFEKLGEIGGKVLNTVGKVAQTVGSIIGGDKANQAQGGQSAGTVALPPTIVVNQPPPAPAPAPTAGSGRSLDSIVADATGRSLVLTQQC